MFVFLFLTKMDPKLSRPGSMGLESGASSDRYFFFVCNMNNLIANLVGCTSVH